MSTATSAAAPVADTSAATGARGFDSAAAWTLNPQVAVRPEPFGALLYHFGNRRLSFLKNRTVVGVVQTLAEHSSAVSALDAAGIAEGDRPRYLQALAALAESQMITPR